MLRVVEHAAGVRILDQLLHQRFDSAQPVPNLCGAACGCGYAYVGELLANAPGPTTLASLAGDIPGRCERAPDLAPLALPAALSAFADLPPLGRLSPRRQKLGGWEVSICHSRRDLLNS